MTIYDDHYLGGIEDRVLRDTETARAAGAKVVGVYCAFTPKELIAAAGAIPVALCSGSDFPIPLAEQHLPRNLCALIKSSYGHAIGDSCPYFRATDLLIADATCDGKKKMFELLGRKRPLYLLQLPQTSATAESHAYWLGELRRIKVILEEETGTVITDDAIRKQIRLYNRLRTIVHEAFLLNTGPIPLLSGRELDTVTSVAGFELNLETRIAEITAALGEIKERNKDDDYIASVAGRPRILLTGCPTTNRKVLHLLEDCGGIVVAMESCGGLKTVGGLVPEQGDPLENLAHNYLSIPCACMTPNMARLELLRAIIRNYRIDGVVELAWDGCHTYNVESFQVEECVQGTGLPYLHVITDYSENDTGQLKTRIEAFLELLN
jgi:benzoyl-CoA reductase/2-hydroxyglutaryl-CoA dehydratase subunit BcrC/BadD/HgdB